MIETCTFSNNGINSEVNVNDKRVDNPVVIAEILVTSQNLGPWMHVQKQGRRIYGRGGSAGKNDGRELSSRYDVLVDLEEDLNNGDYLGGGDHGANLIGKIGENSKEGNNRENLSNMHGKGREDKVRNKGNINMGNKGKNKVDNGVVLKEVNPNRPTSEPINKEAQLDGLDTNETDKQGEIMTLD